MDQLLPFSEIKKAVAVAHQDSVRGQVLELYVAGGSLSGIGDKLGMTRGQVSGIIHRARKKGLLPPVEVTANKAPSEPKPVRPKHERLHPFAFTAPRKPKKRHRRRIRMIDLALEVTLRELEPHHCRWPNGDPQNSDFRFCGNKRNTSGPYCDYHAQMAGRIYGGPPKPYKPFKVSYL